MSYAAIEGRVAAKRGVLTYSTIMKMQNTQYSETAKEHVPYLVCTHLFCSRCEDDDDSERDCERCGNRKYAFWDNPVGVFHILLH